MSTDMEMGLKDATYGIAMVNCEQMSAAASHLSRNWGEYGYRLGIVRGGSPAIFGCRAGDGSEFYFLVDRYGNVEDIPQGDRLTSST